VKGIKMFVKNPLRKKTVEEHSGDEITSRVMCCNVTSGGAGSLQKETGYYVVGAGRGEPKRARLSTQVSGVKGWIFKIGNKRNQS